MKLRLTIILAFFFVTACHHPVKVVEPVETPSSELVAIDSLMWRQPDSALVCLLPYFDTCSDGMSNNSTPYDKHYANLLLAELLYKNDYPQTNRMELLKAVNYFDSLCLCKNVARNVSTIAFLDARAHYINGVGFYENNNMVEACAEYLKALEIMENFCWGKELVGKRAQFMALTNTRLTVLFSDLYLHEQAIYFDKAALACYNKFKAESWHVAWIFDEIGTQYDMMENYDTACYYYNKGLSILSDSSNLTYRDISTHLAYLSYKIGEDSKIVLNKMRNLTAQAESLEETLARLGIIGEIFYHERMLDSALIYLNEVFCKTEIIDSKKQMAEWLVEINKALGKESEIIVYAEYLVPFANQEENKSAVKSQLTEMYNTFRQNELVRKHKETIRNNTKYTLFIVGGLLVVLFTVIIIHIRRKKNFTTQLEAESHAHQMKQKALSGRLKSSNEALRNTMKRLEEKEVELKTIENNSIKHLSADNYEAFKQMPVCKEILNTVGKLYANKQKTPKTDMDVREFMDYALSVPQMALLSKTIETVYPNLHASLERIYPNLNRNDWLHCCLYLLQLDKMSICVLLQEPYYTCRRCTLKLEEAFNCRHALTAFLIEQVEVC